MEHVCALKINIMNVDKKEKEKDWVDKRVEEIESWGSLQLMMFLKDTLTDKFTKDRNILFYNSGRSNKYHGSPLEVHDTISATITSKVDEYIEKLYCELSTKEKDE